MRSRLWMLQEEIKPDASAGLSGYGEKSETPPTPPTPAETAGSNNPPPPVPPAPEGKPNEKAGDNPAEKKPEVTPDVTGYNADGTPVTPPAPKPDDAKPPETPETPAEDKPLELDLKGLEENNVADLRELAKAHKFTKEQTQVLVDARKVALDKIAKDQVDYDNEVKETHKRWGQELQADPDFGGGNFAQNIHNVNKLINEHLPNFKKQLTDTGAKVPPMYMKDLANLAKTIYGEGKFVNGGGAGTTPKPWHPTDAYKES